MHTPIDDRLEHATESAFGRFLYKFVFPAVLVVTGGLMVRAINELDASLADLKNSATGQALVQERIRGDVQAIRIQVDSQAKIQSLIDSQQNARLDQVDSVLLRTRIAP